MKSRYSRPWGVVAVTVAGALVSGCSSSHDDLNEWMVQQRNSVKPKVEPVQEPKPFVPQQYTSANAISPFSDEKLTSLLRNEMLAAAHSGLMAAEVKRRKEYLEQVPLDDMLMTGILERKGQRVGLIRVQAENKLYQVRVGNYLGLNYGLIQSISESEIKLREIVQDATGEWVERATTLQLQEGTKK